MFTRKGDRHFTDDDTDTGK